MGRRSTYMQVLPFPAELNLTIPKFTNPGAKPLLPLLFQLTCWGIFSIHILKLFLCLLPEYPYSGGGKTSTEHLKI